MAVTREPALEGLGLVCHELNVKAALRIACADQSFQLVQVLARDGLIIIGPDRMSLQHSFSDIHFNLFSERRY
jgi:hypothetical protein